MRTSTWMSSPSGAAEHVAEPLGPEVRARRSRSRRSRRTAQPRRDGVEMFGDGLDHAWHSPCDGRRHARTRRGAVAWRAWLAAHHADSDGVWLVTAKKGTTGVSRDEALEEALCHGWIDGQARQPGRRHVPPALHAPPPTQRVVAAQHEDRRAAHRGGPDAPGRARGGGAGQGRRALGRGVRRVGDHRGPGRSGGGAEGRAGGAGDVRHAHRPRPVRRALPDRARPNARDTAAADREVRRDARAARRSTGRADNGGNSSGPDNHQGSRAAARVAQRGASHSTGAATITVAPTASAATPIESSA